MPPKKAFVIALGDGSIPPKAGAANLYSASVTGLTLLLEH
jgi:hypothetical protein